MCNRMFAFVYLHIVHSVFQGHEGRFSIYVHASRENPEHESPLFVGRDIRSEKVLQPLYFLRFLYELFTAPSSFLHPYTYEHEEKNMRGRKS